MVAQILAGLMALAVVSTASAGEASEEASAAGGGRPALWRSLDGTWRVPRTLLRPVVMPQPVWPLEARLAGLHGEHTCEVEVDLRRSGAARAAGIEGCDAHLHAEVVRAVRRWRFEPVRVDGARVEARFVLPVTLSGPGL